MECSICLDRPDGRLRLRCGHVFCRDCIEEWYMNSEEPKCPNCRRKFTFNHLDESREAKLEDKLFGEMLDQIIEDWACFDLESDEVMDEIWYVQSTIKALKELNVPDDDIRECCDYGEWYLWKPFETRRPPIFWEPQVHRPIAIHSINKQNSRAIMPKM